MLTLLRQWVSRTSDGKQVNQYLCVCGNITEKREYLVRRGITKSCGCQAINLMTQTKEQQLRQQGKLVARGTHPLYKRWRGMVARCRNPGHGEWENYGGRGIRVCERWHVFENFLQDMGNPPDSAQKWTLERINNDGNYEPENVRWATPKEQVLNRRPGRRKAPS